LISAAIVVFILASVARGDEPKTNDELQRLAGVWVFDAMEVEAGGATRNETGRVWTSTVTIGGDTFALARPMQMFKPITGKIALNPAAGAQAVDLIVDEYNFAAAGAPVQLKITTGILQGLYRIDRNRLEVVFASEPGLKRPPKFDWRADKTYRLKLVKAPDGFKEFPKRVTLRVTDAAGKAAAGVTVSDHLSRRSAPPGQKDAKTEWQEVRPQKTDADGKVSVTYARPAMVVRDAERKLMAILPPSPAAWAVGEIAVTLKLECHITGSITCEELTTAGTPLGWTNVYLEHDGTRLASCDSWEGKFEFFVPPGDYTLYAYGESVLKRTVPISVSEGRAEFAAEPIALNASRLKLLEGKPAPELAGVVGWKGTPVKLADLRGKYVLLEFTGHWCEPCMYVMPEFIALHERFKDKDLVIIGVHVDIDGEVDTAVKLDEKLAMHRKNLWKGKDIPFPVALVSGKEVGEGERRWRGQAAQQYGVTGYPTTVLIDREGKVVGPFGARSAKESAEKIEKLLEQK
jgi:uncharacterized protein (TIGR03067 family)